MENSVSRINLILYTKNSLFAIFFSLSVTRTRSSPLLIVLREVRRFNAGKALRRPADTASAPVFYILSAYKGNRWLKSSSTTCPG